MAFISSLPPVRRAIALQRTKPERGKATFQKVFGRYNVHLVDSGTTALAVALADARQRRATANPEVVLPAYGCPQLVAACLSAAVRPRLVDISPDSWGYDLQSLAAALTRDTVAVVAVNLLGVGDQAKQISPMVLDAGALLVQDSAQYLPGEHEIDWFADYVVLSFGRGKPLNLLRGGALLVPRELNLSVPMPSEGSGIRDLLMGSRGAAVAFNLATHPLVYGLTCRLPGLGVGATRFEPLGRPTSLPLSTWAQVGPAFEQYSREAYPCPWAGVTGELEKSGFRVLGDTANTPLPRRRRLRFAMLADGVTRRDAVLRALGEQGLGASSMYGASLDNIQGIPADVRRQGPFPNAAAFAERLLTLPTHSYVTEATVTRALACMRAKSV